MDGAELGLDRIAWPQVADYLGKDDRLAFVIGSCEQHGPHLPFTVDVAVPWEIATRAARTVGVLLAPPIAYGMLLHHTAFPGTLSLRPETLIAVLRDLLLCAQRAGFRKIAIVNGHGGNRAALHSAAMSSLFDLPDLQVKVIHWWGATGGAGGDTRTVRRARAPWPGARNVLPARA
jgi:creatinine amidohydrolase